MVKFVSSLRKDISSGLKKICKQLKHLFYGGIKMQYINKRKLIGLITNEWFGIETCKVEDIISFLENIPDEISTNSSWTSIIEKLPTREEYLTIRDDNVCYYTRLEIAFQTDTVMYDIGYYDGYKWFTDKHSKIENVIAWRPFIEYKE